MLTNLKKIYQDKLIEDVTSYSNDYYYFYKSNSNKKLFGVPKTITTNEYELLKEMYIEKKIYTLDKHIQKCYEYLLDDGVYPFKNKKMKMIIYTVNENDEEVVYDVLNEVYTSCVNVKLYNLNICFFEETSTKIVDLFETLAQDLGYNIILHEGLIIHSGYKGIDILSYIKFYHDSVKVNSKEHSDLADMLLFQDYSKHQDLMLAIKTNLFDVLLQDVLIRDIIQVMLKNDLNVSQSAKLLYMNRNSLINKLDSIYKETGLNIQKFTHACVLYFILNLI